jgi:hypothetical protein
LERKDVEVGKNVVVNGWGKKKEGGDERKNMRKVNVKIVREE